ncbi:hypothetical protein HS088_TW13G00191 [Tripterygium wilfordii]|uniref:Uncharacterized protein n=1 Tax=Tripterygium wilfordii TaxID=458696 RepID=A0A7J7CT80_TRIWF|nr:uncharacterized protein LOC120012975 [Tripterygium wilfordii]KAF5737312.1 hypothetical protein HS088_TW13G00191 [Tripterygium wilfordii]
MAYRRRQGITRASTFKEEIHHQPDDHLSGSPALNSSYSFSPSSSSSTQSSSLAAQAIRASAARRESSFASESQRSKGSGFAANEDTPSGKDPRGFWGVLAHKAKAILEDDIGSQQFENPSRSRFQMPDDSSGGKFQQPYQQSSDNLRKMDNPTFRKGLDKLTSSLNQIGDTFEKAFEEGRTIVENKTADIIQETRKLQMRRKGNSPEAHNRDIGISTSWQPLVPPAQPLNQANHDIQLKASRDVAMATAAKAKLLLRELKTVKADLAFAKARCSQLEEENKILRENREKGSNAADDDLIRLQLETLLAEKARLAHENSIFARENRFLREIVEYHQLTMQDVVYLDEGNEEVTEVYPIAKMLSVSPPSPTSPDSHSGSPTVPISPPDTPDISASDSQLSSATQVLEENKENSGKTSPLDSSTQVPAEKVGSISQVPSD